MTKSSGIERVRGHIGSLPYMTFAQAMKLDRLLSEYNVHDCLELGFFHGVSSAYIAAILEKNGGGHLTTIDREDAKKKSPNIDKLLCDLNLERYVTVYYEPRSYTWRLMKLLEANPEPQFDFCYIDGGHSWDVTGFGFFLVERLLRPGGWLLLDDLDWTHESLLKTKGNSSWLSRMSREEITTAQVRKVWELLVKPHPAFHDCREEGAWGYARKRTT